MLHNRAGVEGSKQKMRVKPFFWEDILVQKFRSCLMIFSKSASSNTLSFPLKLFVHFSGNLKRCAERREVLEFALAEV